jgi:hypothetical protein
MTDTSAPGQKSILRRSLPLLLVGLIIVLTVVWVRSSRKNRTNEGFGPGTLKVIRVPGGTLYTSGLVKTESFNKEAGSWRGTTTSDIRFNATYRYEIPLRDQWKVFIDEHRKIAYIGAPAYKPQLPVAVDSKTVEEKTAGGFLRFDKWDLLQELRQEISPLLEAKAKSPDYIGLVRDDARKTVREFVRDWMVKNSLNQSGEIQDIIVFFADEKDVEFPKGIKIEDFLP